jgi:1-acyl-sn-glycerol-3-phosphate acyltransferase
MKLLLSPVLYTLWRVRVEGGENLPSSGPVILAANHRSFCDSLFLPLVMRRQVTFVAKSEYFDSWRTAWFFRAAGQIPMKREGGSASARALASAAEVLAAGGVLGIYPEGTRSPDGRLYRGRTGVARLAMSTGATLVPVGIEGTAEVQPVGARLMRPFRTVTIRFGRPLEVSARAETAMSDALAAREITDELMYEIRELTGQDYVDRYAKQPPA